MKTLEMSRSFRFLIVIFFLAVASDMGLAAQSEVETSSDDQDLLPYKFWPGQSSQRLRKLVDQTNILLGERRLGAVDEEKMSEARRYSDDIRELFGNYKAEWLRGRIFEFFLAPSYFEYCHLSCRIALHAQVRSRHATAIQLNLSTVNIVEIAHLRTLCLA